MTAQQAQNIVLLLQSEPMYYRNFGVYWWYVKKQLKRHGHTRDELQHLGSYDDPTAAHHLVGSGDELTSAALRFQAHHTYHKRNSAHTFAPDGDTYIVFDADAE